MGAFEKITETDIRTAVANIDFRLTSMTRDQFADRLVGLMNGSLTPRQVQGVSDEDVERIYAFGYSAFQAGRLDDARGFFRWLCANDYVEARWWIGLGAVEYAAEDYPAALKAYGFACAVDAADPRPRMRAADCFMTVGDAHSALLALEEGVELCGDDPKHAERKTRAEGMIRLLEARVSTAVEA